MGWILGLATPTGATPQAASAVPPRFHPTLAQATPQNSTPQNSTPSNPTPQDSTPQKSTPSNPTPQDSPPQNSTPNPSTVTDPASPAAAQQLDLSPETVENSPVLQRWLEDIPDVLSEIRNDPGFRTRVRVGYSQFPSSDRQGGIHVGIEDVFLGQSPVTLSGDYQTTFQEGRSAYGAELRYYVLPLGNAVNIAPVAGYRRVEGEDYAIDGVNLGLRLQLQLSRTGAADVAVTQSWVNPGSNSAEVGITTLTFGYAVTEQLRLSTDLQRQNSPQQKDNRVGVGLEWML